MRPGKDAHLAAEFTDVVDPPAVGAPAPVEDARAHVLLFQFAHNSSYRCPSLLALGPLVLEMAGHLFPDRFQRCGPGLLLLLPERGRHPFAGERFDLVDQVRSRLHAGPLHLVLGRPAEEIVLHGHQFADRPVCHAQAREEVFLGPLRPRRLRPW